MSVLLLFPNQLFPTKELSPVLAQYAITEVIVVEDPCFYGDRPMKLKLNKLRLAYQYAVVRSFAELNKYTLWKYDDMKNEDYAKRMYQMLCCDTKAEIHIFDPMDHYMLRKIKTWITGSKLIIHETPSFLLSHEEIYIYWHSKSPRKSMNHADFFTYAKKKYKILEQERSHDVENRGAFPEDAALPPLPWKGFNGVQERTWKQAEEWVERHFPLNPGGVHVDILSRMATTHMEARMWFARFLRERFELYGKYQDAIVSPTQSGRGGADGSTWMYHSGVSVYLNFGLITPGEVLEMTRKHYHALGRIHKLRSLSSYEGFVRQLLGWREYCRLYYVMVPVTVWRRNVFNLKKSRQLPRIWYEGKTGVPIVDRAITNSFRIGYLHHIQRLMVMSNYMTLCRIHPDHIYRWMYEFSMDSWEWVMVFNVYGMGTWSDGGFAMRKPYISSSAYIRKISREPKGEWEGTWNMKWREFLRDYRDVLLRTPLAGIVRATNSNQ